MTAGPPSSRGSASGSQPGGISYTALGLLLGVVGAGFGALSQMAGLERFYIAIIVAVIVGNAVAATVYMAKLSLSELIILATAAALVAVVCAGFAWSGWDEHQQATERAAISLTIDDAAQAEAGWYKNPSADRAAELERYYVAAGPGIGAIRQAVVHFRNEQCRWGASANEVINIDSISITGSRATAQTHEFYHQPRVCTGPPPATRGLGDERARVTYELVSGHAGWRIFASSASYLR